MDEAVYVSCVPGALVTRFGSLGGPNLRYIGARVGKGKVEFDRDVVVMIPMPEFNRFRKEYTRAIRDKNLKKRTRAAFEKYRAAKTAKPEPAATAEAEASQPPVVPLEAEPNRENRT